MSINLSEQLVRTIRERMQSKPSGELKAILDGRDEEQWSPEAFEAVRQILDERSRTGVEPVAEPQVATHSLTTSARVAALAARYRDAYRVASVITGLGTTIKIVGVILALPVAVAGISSGDTRYVLAGLFIAAVIWTLFFFVGVLVSAQGQILNACLDTAVSGSPHASEDEKARIMSLP